MAIKYTLNEGGYVKTDGEIQIVGIGEDGTKHAERGQCRAKHGHTKDCAKALLDHKPVLQEAGVDGRGDHIPEQLEPSIRERMEKWFLDYDATPDDPVEVEMPKRTVRVNDGKGKLVDKEVEDRDL